MWWNFNLFEVRFPLSNTGSTTTIEPREKEFQIKVIAKQSVFANSDSSCHRSIITPLSIKKKKKKKNQKQKKEIVNWSIIPRSGIKILQILIRCYVSSFKEIKGDIRFDNCNFCHDPFDFQISASAGPIPRVDDTQARLPSPVRSDSKRVDERSAESVEDVAHIRERFGFQASHHHRRRLAQFSARLPRAHRVLHYRYNVIQSDVKLIIDFLPPTSKRYRADASTACYAFRDCEAEASVVPRAI